MVRLNESLWTQRWRLFLVAGVLAPAAMGLVGLILASIAGADSPSLLRWPGWGALGLGSLVGMASIGLVAALYKSHPAFEEALRRSGTKVGEDALRIAGYPVMLVIVTTAGIGEELLFRGGLQPLIGLVPAALLFGLSHGGWRKEMWAYAVAAALSGTLFGLAYHWSGDLYVPMVAHALHNILSTLLLGKKVDIAWEGYLPRVRLLKEAPWPEADEDSGAEPEGGAGADGAASGEMGGEPGAEPVSTSGDGPPEGADDGDPPAGPRQ